MCHIVVHLTVLGRGGVEEVRKHIRHKVQSRRLYREESQYSAIHCPKSGMFQPLVESKYVY